MSRDSRNQEPEDQLGAGSSSGQELDWLAFRYVSDEMPDAQREEFEKRLETDTEAQLALVDVVRSTQLIFAALDSQEAEVGLPDRAIGPRGGAKANSKPALQRYGSLLAAAAAILLMVAGWAIYSQNGSGVASNASSDLAVVWADTLTARELVMMEAELDELADETEFEDFVSYGSLEESDGWMYMALVEMEESVEVPE